MKNLNVLKNDSLLLLTACIWGFAFVAQRVGMDFIGPFAYNGIRFALGALSLLPLWLYRKKKNPVKTGVSIKKTLIISGFAGVFLFAGSSFQQVGIINTTAGNAGFITGFYVVLVPIMALFFKEKSGKEKWLGAILALAGLFFLSVQESFTIAPGDFLVFISAFFWASHVLIIGRFSGKIDPILLSILQFVFCSILSLITAFFTEEFAIEMVIEASIPILYGGLFSVGIAYTLQVVAQKDAPPAHAAIILSMESLFAVIGGIIILHEPLTGRSLLGCILMLSGMLCSQGALTGLLKLKNRQTESGN